MSKPIPIETFKKELFDLLAETFENTQGIYLDRNTSLFETLETVSAAQASKQVSPKGGTVAGHVEHMSFYLSVLTDCIQRKPVGQLNWQDSWKLTEVDDAKWGATK